MPKTRIPIMTNVVMTGRLMNKVVKFMDYRSVSLQKTRKRNSFWTTEDTEDTEDTQKAPDQMSAHYEPGQSFFGNCLKNFPVAVPLCPMCPLWFKNRGQSVASHRHRMCLCRDTHRRLPANPALQLIEVRIEHRRHVQRHDLRERQP